MVISEWLVIDTKFWSNSIWDFYIIYWKICEPKCIIGLKLFLFIANMNIFLDCYQCCCYSPCLLQRFSASSHKRCRYHFWSKYPENHQRTNSCSHCLWSWQKGWRREECPHLWFGWWYFWCVYFDNWRGYLWGEIHCWRHPSWRYVYFHTFRIV